MGVCRVNIEQNTKYIQSDKSQQNNALICLVFITSSTNYIYKTMKFLEHESENTPKELFQSKVYFLNNCVTKLLAMMHLTLC